MYGKDSGKPKDGDPPGPQASGPRKSASIGRFISASETGSLATGETMYEHALKYTQSHRLQKALGKR
jgi:hypothetical protein